MNNKPAIVVTVIVAVLAVAAVIFALNMFDEDSSGNPTNNGQHHADGLSDFVPTSELETEMFGRAKQLMRDNYEVFRLFYLMPYDMSEPETHFEPEPYSNVPEDGYYTLKPGFIGYETVDEIIDFVKSVYVETAAESILNFSKCTTDNGPVYADKNGRIGVNAGFTPMKYNLIWESASFTLDFISETEVLITVIIDCDDAAVTEGTVKQARILKEADSVWRLENIFY